MSIYYKKFVATLLLIPLCMLAVVATPQLASAAAGDGGGGGSAGCSKWNYTTCFGAVWRYYQTSSNSVALANIDGSQTYVTGCGSTGGFFAYVLVHKNYPYDPSYVRSWKIGPNDGDPGDRSMFFGGWTNYRVFSQVSDPMPTNLSPGDYSWYSVEKAFAQTKALGQNSGYEWNASSSLGWFCYRGLDYTLSPTMNASPDAGEGGSTATLSPTVNNTGSTPSSNIEWQVTNFAVGPGGVVPTGSTNSTQMPVTHYANGATVIQSGSSTFARGVSAVSANPHTMPDVAVGTRICYALSVRPYNQSAGTNWRHSTPDCVIIAKKPKVQVLGGDLVVGKGQTSTIVTSSTTKSFGGSNRTFGSWGEYAVAASGRVTAMVSGAAYSGGAASNSTCTVNLLTFANVNANQATCGNGTQMGNYANAKTLPDVGARLNTTSSLGNNPSVDLAAVSTGSYSATGNVTVNAGATIAKGKWVVINAPTATVTITSNIHYTNEVLQVLSDIPQVVIIANEIRIAGGVTNVDAWLIANGTTGNLITCSDVAAANQLNATTCNQKLTVNGPVAAKHLYLYRTAGAGTAGQSGDPAEVFNLRPDAYLWATSYSSGAGRLQTITTKELPPRF